MKINGFTLIEILIALLIFAILSAVAAVGLRSVIHTHQKMKIIDREFEQIQTAATFMRRDFSQIIQRSISSESGAELPALVITSTHYLEFTSAGYSNPNAVENRSTLRRVAYEWENGKLVRLTWPVLDRPPRVVPERRVLLNHVTGMTLMYVNDQGQLVNVWAMAHFPRAIVLALTLSRFGVWEGVFPISARGFYDEK